LASVMIASAAVIAAAAAAAAAASSTGVSLRAGARNGIPVFAMMPLDAVNADCTLKNPQETLQQLQQVRSSGVRGVMIDVWHGIVEPNPRAYNFSAYVQLADMVASQGMKLQAVMSFHSCGSGVGDECNIPLPSWVLSVPGVFYTDREGAFSDEYVSLFADTQPLFQPGGRTILDVYEGVMRAFANAMGSRMGSVVVEIQVGLGPSGELRYPAYPSNRWSFPGVGEFQSYDRYALQQLAAAAAAAGHPEWGNGGPSNTGTYNSQPPSATGFFGSGFDNYQSAYGNFFLSWYTSSLIAHGDRVMARAASAFQGTGAHLVGKVAGIHWWYKDQSHAAELTAGYYNTNGRDGYLPITQMFAKYGATLDFTCMEMRDSEQPGNCACGPYELFQQAKVAARNAGINIAGENALARYDWTAYSTMIDQATNSGIQVEAITYLRLGSTLLQPNNLATFTSFVQTLAGK